MPFDVAHATVSPGGRGQRHVSVTVFEPELPSATLRRRSTPFAGAASSLVIVTVALDVPSVSPLDGCDSVP